MWKFGALASLALLMTSSVAQQAQAQARVEILGCVSRGVENGCLIITDRRFQENLSDRFGRAERQTRPSGWWFA